MNNNNISDSVYAKASEYLAGDENTNAMVDKIIEHTNNGCGSDLIDYIDGVTVWEKVEFTFTCREFLELIGYSK